MSPVTEDVKSVLKLHEIVLLPEEEEQVEFFFEFMLEGRALVLDKNLELEKLEFRYAGARYIS